MTDPSAAAFRIQFPGVARAIDALKERELAEGLRADRLEADVVKLQGEVAALLDIVRGMLCGEPHPDDPSKGCEREKGHKGTVHSSGRHKRSV